MNINTKKIKLMKHGISESMLRNLTERQIDILSDRLFESKKENKEQSQPGVTTTITTEKKTTINPSALDTSAGVTLDGVNLKKQGGQIVATQMREEEDLEDLALADEADGMDPNKALALSMTEKKEMREKFESHAQQGMMWARCNKSKGKEKEKWCKMAREFSKSTTKKDYKKMPDKKHPEKSIPKSEYMKETNEGYMEALGNTYFKLMGDKLSELKPSLKWEGELEKKMSQIIERNLSPKMSKKDLMKFIKEQSPTIAPPKPQTPTKPSPSTPYRPKPGPKPGPKAGKGDTSPTIAPPKPKTPTKPSPSTPYSPKPGPKPGPKASKEDLPNWLTFDKLDINFERK